MTARTLLGALLSGGLLLTAFAQGCGQSVATCATVAGLPGAPTSFQSMCEAEQAACTTAGCSANIQAFLTCVDDAQTYTAVDGLCAELQKAAGNTTQSIPDAGLSDSTIVPCGPCALGSTCSPNGTCIDTCASATCASICAAAGDQAAACTSSCEAAESTCDAEGLAEFQALLTCICTSGGLTTGSGMTGSESCEAEAVVVEQSCSSGGTTIVFDAG